MPESSTQETMVRLAREGENRPCLAATPSHAFTETSLIRSSETFLQENFGEGGVQSTARPTYRRYVGFIGRARHSVRAVDQGTTASVPKAFGTAHNRRVIRRIPVQLERRCSLYHAPQSEISEWLRVRSHRNRE